MTRFRALGAVVVSVFVFAGSGAGIAASAQQTQALPGVSLAGISVQGLEAKHILQRAMVAARVAESRPVQLRAGDRVWTYTARDFGVTVDVESTAQATLTAGRRNPIDWLRHTLKIRRADIKLIPKVDVKRFDQAVRELATLVRREASNGAVTFDQGRVQVSLPAEGIVLQPPQAKRLLMNRLLDARFTSVVLPIKATAPRVTSDQIRAVRQRAESLLAAPVLLRYGGREFSLAPEGVAKALRVDMERVDLSVDPEALRNEVLTIADWLAVPPKDARFKVEGDRVRIIPSEPGRTFDAALTAAELVARQPGSGALELKEVAVEPERSTDQAKALGIAQKVGTYTTTFDARNAPRVANIDIMAKAIDDTVLGPGETFSLNQTTGPRTPDNGYKEAQIIVDGELVPGIGGGVCQVATTIFNAVLAGGYEVIERTNHSLYISKYPLGRDATVNYGLQDLSFRNDSSFGMLIKAAVNSRGITVTLYSTALGRTVEMSTSERRNPRPPLIKYVDDPSIPAGQEVVKEPGSEGFDVTVTRKVLANGSVLHSDTFVSKYRPWKRIVHRGTGPAASPAPSPATSTG